MTENYPPVPPAPQLPEGQPFTAPGNFQGNQQPPQYTQAPPPAYGQQPYPQQPNIQPQYVQPLERDRLAQAHRQARDHLAQARGLRDESSDRREHRGWIG